MHFCGLKTNVQILLVSSSRVFVVQETRRFPTRSSFLFDGPVQIDHFSFIDKRTFELRYYISHSFWEPSEGPIFLYIGDEKPIESSIRNSGFVWESARRLHALVIFAEHRFYGRSLPFGNLSFTEPQYYSYLTTQQALADFVDLIYHLRTGRRRTLSSTTRNIPNPVIAFGGSYGGMLAAWIRMKYPAIIEGALASSAPIWSFAGMMECDAIAKKVTSIYAKTYKLCPVNIRAFWDELNYVTETREGRQWVSAIWKLCQPLETTQDIDEFRQMLRLMFYNIALANHPYPMDTVKPLPANPVKEVCIYLNSPNMTGDLLVETVSKASSVYFNYTRGKTCIDWREDRNFNVFSGVVEAWSLQTCMDVVRPFCSNGKTDMFYPVKWTFQSWENSCFLKYKLHPVENVAEKVYGGVNIDSASNIIFSNGELDPWIVGGVTREVFSPTIVTAVLSKASHHLDLYAAHANDPDSVKEAREMYEKVFKDWIAAYYKKHESFHHNKFLSNLFNRFFSPFL